MAWGGGIAEAWVPAFRGCGPKHTERVRQLSSAGVTPPIVTDAEWEQIKSLHAQAVRSRGANLAWTCREVLNAIALPCPESVCGWRIVAARLSFAGRRCSCRGCRRFARGLLTSGPSTTSALMLDREQAGREASPSAGVLDSQTVKAPAASGGGGYDAAKRLKGRKRHIAVDTDGRLLMVNLTTADVQDAAGAEAIIVAVRKRWPWLKHLFADGAYDRGKLMSKAAYRRLRRRGRAQAGEVTQGLSASAAQMGGREDVRLDDALATAGA